MKIEIKDDIYNLVGRTGVYFKNNTFYIGEINFYSLTKIIKLKNHLLYDEIIKNKEICKYALDSLIYDNKDISIEQIMDYLLKCSIDDIIDIGENYKDYLFQILKKSKFEKDNFKGLIYDDLKMNYDFMFSNFPYLKVLFVYNDKEEILNILDKKGRIIKKQKISESDMYLFFEKFKESSLKEEVNNYWNQLLKDILNKVFNLETFLEDFRDEIFNRLGNILMIVDLNEENEKTLNKYKEENKLSNELCKILSDKLKQKNNLLEKKYGLKL